MLLAFDKLSFSLVTKLCSKLNSYFDAAFEPCLDESVEVNSSDSPLDEKLDERYVALISYNYFSIVRVPISSSFMLVTNLININVMQYSQPFQNST